MSIDWINGAIGAVWKHGDTPTAIVTSPRVVRWFARATMRKRQYRRWRGRMKSTLTPPSQP